jgi:hypothetical protein
MSEWEWSKLRNEELNDLHSSPNIIWMMKSRIVRWAGHVWGIGAYRVLVGKAEGKRTFGRPRHSWEDKIKMDLQEVEWGGGGRLAVPSQPR